MEVGQKVKMKLIQPAIKCSGRGDVSCHYRGKVVALQFGYALIEFKQYGEVIEGHYDLVSKEFKEEEYKDIKIV